MKALLVAATLILGSPAVAQSVSDCGDFVSAASLAEPWEQNTATFANGDVRLAIIDMLEPAAAAVHLMVLSPPRTEIGDRQCKLISLSQPDGGLLLGFFNIDLAEHSAAYDPKKGLIVTVPVQLFSPETGDGEPAALTLVINQSTGNIMADIQK